GDDPAMMALWPTGWGFHLANLAMGTGYAMLATAAVGLVVGLQARRRELWPLLVFGLVSFVMIAGAEVRYARYAMPLLPLIAVFSAGVVSDDFLALAGGKLHAWAMAGAASVLIVGSVLAAGVMDYRLLEGLTQADPREHALQVLEEHVPDGGSIGLITEPWFYHPPVDYCNGGVALRDNPLWAAYRDPVRDLAVLGLEPDALRREMPDAVVLTGFEVFVREAAGVEDAEEFVDALPSLGYERVFRVRGSVWAAARARPVAQDLRYPFPWIELWVRDAP
ncbi:MAG: hypothetical protein ACOCX2_11665, partial [Armatimonadota bacterium]